MLYLSTSTRLYAEFGWESTQQPRKASVRRPSTTVLHGHWIGARFDEWRLLHLVLLSSNTFWDSQSSLSVQARSHPCPQQPMEKLRARFVSPLRILWSNMYESRSSGVLLVRRTPAQLGKLW